MSSDRPPRPAPTSGAAEFADLVRRPRRADARRNYDLQLKAAGDAFAEYGAAASLDDIARRAGVGNATLYRHFPTRHALLVAVSVDEVQALCSEGEELRRTQPPGDALATWLQAFVRHITSKQGLAGALMSDPAGTSEVIAASNAAIRAITAALLSEAQQATVARGDVDPDDLLTLARAIAAASETGGKEQADRLLSLALRGIRV